MAAPNPWIPISKRCRAPPFDTTLVRVQGFRHLYSVDEMITGVAVGCTLVEYGSEEECRSVLREMIGFQNANGFLSPTTYTVSGSHHYWLYRQVFIRFDEWVRLLMSDAASAVEKATSVFAQVLRVVRDRLMKNKGSFTSLRESFGVTEDNKVLFVKPPSGITDFHNNILELKDMADYMITTLRQVAPLPALLAFSRFIKYQYLKLFQNTVSKMQRFLYCDGVETAIPMTQFIAVHHPIGYDDWEILRFFNNLARLGDPHEKYDDPNMVDTCLSFYNKWKTTSGKIIRSWRQKMESDPVFYDFLHFDEFGVEYSQYRFRAPSFPMFVNITMKHYWQRATKMEKNGTISFAPKLSKTNVVKLMEKLYPGIIYVMYIAYAIAVFDGYEHCTFFTQDMFTEKEGFF